MTTDHLRRLSAETALNNMMEGRYFDICTIDKVAAVLNVQPEGDAYKILRPLHCVDWAKMPAELRDAVPGLIEKCLGVAPTYRFKLPREASVIVDITPARQPERRGFLRLLGGGR